MYDQICEWSLSEMKEAIASTNSGARPMKSQIATSPTQTATANVTAIGMKMKVGAGNSRSSLATRRRPGPQEPMIDLGAPADVGMAAGRGQNGRVNWAAHLRKADA